MEWVVPTDTNTQRAFANDANNRVVTGDGSGGLNGEANLTFDGSTLFVNGDGTGGRISASNGNLSLSDGNGRQILRIDDPGSGNSHTHIFDSSGRFLKGVTSSEASRSNTSARNPHVQFSSPWSSGLGSTSITCTDDYPILFLNSNATYQDNAGAGVLTFSVKDGAGNYCNTASIRSQIDGTPGNNDSPGELSFSTSDDGACNPVERMRISHNGHVSINDGNLVIGTAGKGIDFSANSHASGMSSETLDSYEEGSWTPSFGGLDSVTYQTQFGRYTKIGRQVFCTVVIDATGIDESNTIDLNGLPFSSADSNDNGQRSTWVVVNGGHNAGITDTTARFRSAGSIWQGVKGTTSTSYLTGAQLCSSGTVNITGAFSFYVS